MPHSDIPDMLGRALSGTKYGVRQTRGKFGLVCAVAVHFKFECVVEAHAKRVNSALL